ncbi:hypothetical protein FHR90_003312 [Endobacter medicaginis]|uniref:Uncharacterized protein n=2 Tax=Endobacter medicaginis TaxID=1181271 RepID=A0A839V0B0_9PROT|nr:hypothetical protein [Endobacter medicaginis]MBB3175456.1 hypothetical protein [Endobacter medicaginis]MCX5476590.1 hypothetical protein [Endobacter medicaginis]MCX5476928.1 hypothetical protein [Endobacter medicaginis]NVN29029.1 hypothetical protein [Endobacter medicaginis]
MTTDEIEVAIATQDITENACVATPTLQWVVLYLIRQVFGGPEEGGWWYEAGEIVTDPELYRDLGGLPRAFLDPVDAHAYRRSLFEGEARLNGGRAPLHSVLSDGLFELQVVGGPVPPPHFPATRPTYE